LNPDLFGVFLCCFDDVPRRALALHMDFGAMLRAEKANKIK
jgi:hypothetical protein